MEIIEACTARYPEHELLTYPDWSTVGPDEFHQVAEKLDRDTLNSITHPINRCIAEMSIRRMQSLAGGRVIFLVTDDYFNDPYWKQLSEILTDASAHVIRSDSARDTSVYKKYWSNPEKFFMVSSSERHPSRLAYKMYAFVIARELQENIKWGYTSYNSTTSY